MINQYTTIFLWIGFIALIYRRIPVQKKENVCGEEVNRLTWWFAFLVFIPIIWMAGNRGYFSDTINYIFSFRDMPNSLSEFSSYLSIVTKDKGFSALSLFIKCFITEDTMWYLTIIALIQATSLIAFFRKYSYSYVISVFLFLASTDYISWMFNGIRQFCAVIIILFGVPFMLKKKYVPLLLLILLASTFHQSALIMIPFVLIAQGEAWNGRTLLFIGMAILAVLFLSEFTTLLNDSLEGTQYTHMVSDYTEWEDDGTNPLRVLVYAVPTILALIGRKTIREEKNPLIHFCTNMSIISTGLYFISMFTSGIFMGRLPIYVSLFGYVLLPWEIEHLFRAETKKIIYISMVSGYLVFYWYQMHIIYHIF